MEVFQLRDTDRDDKLSKQELPAINAAAFGVADENRDGKLSGYEFNQARFARFNALDGNKDGFISLDEVRAYVRRMR
jgi:Ca2+-binding EF-hand superfamily protein